MTGFKVPDITIPEVKLPEVTIPNISNPLDNLPKPELPKIPNPLDNLHAPDIKLPEMPQIPNPLDNFPKSFSEVPNPLDHLPPNPFVHAAQPIITSPDLPPIHEPLGTPFPEVAGSTPVADIPPVGDSSSLPNVPHTGVPFPEIPNEHPVPPVAPLTPEPPQVTISPLEQSINNLPKDLPLPQGSTPWAVAEQLLKEANPNGQYTPADIMAVDKALCEANGIAVPEWGIEGKVLATKLPAGMPLNITGDVKEVLKLVANK